MYEYEYADDSKFWERYEYTYDFTDGCKYIRVWSNSHGDTSTYEGYTCSGSGQDLITKEPTCTQYGERKHTYICQMCGNVDEDIFEIDPVAHSWIYLEEDHYYCGICGLENSNGASGDIVVEDLTDQYGDDEYYVLGYWNRTDVAYETYVSLILKTPLANGDNEVFLDDITLTSIDGVTSIAFSKLEVMIAAARMGYSPEEYDVKFTFVPLGADGSYDYAIIFTDENIEISNDEITAPGKYVTDFIFRDDAARKEFTFTIKPDTTATWTISSSFLNREYDNNWEVRLLDSQGNLIDDYRFYGSNQSIMFFSNTLKAGETYYLRVFSKSYYSYGYIPFEFSVE